MNRAARLERERLVLRMRRLGMTFDGIAREMGLSRSAVAGIVFRAKLRGRA